MSYLMVVFKNAVSDFFGGEIAFDVIAHFFFIDKPHYFKQTIFSSKAEFVADGISDSVFPIGIPYLRSAPARGDFKGDIALFEDFDKFGHFVFHNHYLLFS